MRSDFREKAIYWLFQDRIPLTKLLILSNAVTFFAIQLFDVVAIPANLVCFSETLLRAPWTPLTYPVVAGCGALCMVLSMFWLWIVAGSLERSWGTWPFARFFVAMSVVSALGVLVGGWVVGEPTAIVGMALPLAGLTMAFAMLNPEQEILFFMLFPLKLKYLALLDVGFVLVGYGQQHPLIGVCALAGCAFGYWYVKAGKHVLGSYGRQERARVTRVYRRAGIFSRLNPFRRARDRRERDRLRKLFEDSGLGDEEGRSRE